ncbi:hypothetical protein GGI12_000943 [Dipsacomyces acuminosporus]|nr:hypothetical protein GGI12_000943 [Dipsacomyces acuminosporus]
MPGIALLVSFSQQAARSKSIGSYRSFVSTALLCAKAQGKNKESDTKPKGLTFAKLKLDTRLCQAAEGLYGVTHPTPTQRRLLANITHPSFNLFLRQETGSGKTFALLMGLLSITLKDYHALKGQQRGEPAKILEPLELNALFIVPNRELAFQIEEWADQLLALAYPSLPRAKILQKFVSGSPYEAQQRRVLKRHGLPSIAVGTPRCFIEMLEKEDGPFTIRPPVLINKFVELGDASEPAEYMRALQAVRALANKKQVEPDDFRGLRRLVIDEVDSVLRLPGKHATDKQKNLRKSKPKPGQVLVDAIYDMFGIPRMLKAKREWSNSPVKSLAQGRDKNPLEPKRKHPVGWDKKSDVALAKMFSSAAERAANGTWSPELEKRGQLEIEPSPFSMVGVRSLQLIVSSATASGDLRRWMLRHGWMTSRPMTLDTASNRVEVPESVTHYCLVIENEKAIRNFRPKERGPDGSAINQQQQQQHHHHHHSSLDAGKLADEAPDSGKDSAWEADVTDRTDTEQRTVMELMAEVASNVISELKPTGSVIVFTRSDASTSQFGHVLESFGVHARDIMTRFDSDIRLDIEKEHPLPQKPRSTSNDSVSEPENQQPRVYIATEEAARGIDVRDASLVLILDIPKTANSYAHLSGRAGRFGRKGSVVTVVPVGKLGWYESKMRGIFATLGIRPKKAPFVE